MNKKNKPFFVISCPFDTYSGYGARSRDVVKSIIESDKYEVQLLAQRWGDTPWNFCKDHSEWEFLYDYEHNPRTSSRRQPDIWMQITIPNEFTPIGKYNIGCTAGIEATSCRGEWVEGINRMNETWVSSKFAKNVFDNVKFEKRDQKTNNVIGELKVEKPVHVIFEGIDTNLYKKISKPKTKSINLSSIKEQFCYLFVGHWMNGAHGHDRKNVGVLVKEFIETFKNRKGMPALILKCSKGSNSYTGKDAILKQINSYTRAYKNEKIPNIYLLHGEFTDVEMNDLYNHSKIKAMVSFTKGEGYGRPLLEFSLSGKPVIASGWSGHMDFLHPEFNTFIQGQLENVHPSAANEWLLKEARWFQVNTAYAREALRSVYNNFKLKLSNAKRQAYFAKNNFSREQMSELIDNHLSEVLPEFSVTQELKIPELKIPKLKKV
tara:strand:+ start:1893 stop:3194 length:1302 start_codon:yes stop_codon:yes gene_type:complete